MNLQPRFEKYAGRKEFMRAQHGIEYKTGGASLARDVWGAVGTVIKAGTATFRGDDGFYRPWDTTPTTGTAATAKGAGLISEDVVIGPGDNIAGVIISGHAIESKCTGVNDAFKEATRGYIRFDV